MSVTSLLLFYLPPIAFRRAALKSLATAFPADAAAHIWRKTLDLRSELRTKRARHSPGVNLLLRYLEWDCALYRTVQDHGMRKEQAGRLIEEINWSIFGSVTSTAFAASRLRSSNLRTRVRWILDSMFLLLFTSPFRRKVLASEDGVAFDVVACPLAAYCKEQGVPELTRHAACSLDHRMAREWGIRLDRSQTIAEGARFCDFRFRVPAEPSGRARAERSVREDARASRERP